MAVSENPADGIIVLGVATDTISRNGMPVDFIILNATAAGAFVLVLGRTSITINNSANCLSVVVPVQRHLNTVTLTSGPTAAAAYIFLKKAL
jgi:hypothetical protein